MFFIVWFLLRNRKWKHFISIVFKKSQTVPTSVRIRYAAKCLISHFKVQHFSLQMKWSDLCYPHLLDWELILLMKSVAVLNVVFILWDGIIPPVKTQQQVLLDVCFDVVSDWCASVNRICDDLQDETSYHLLWTRWWRQKQMKLQTKQKTSMLHIQKSKILCFINFKNSVKKHIVMLKMRFTKF